jgi:hypothetical protein
VHGISHTDVFVSVWFTVDAVNACSQLSIVFPADHQRQRELAFGFQQRSRAGFSSCVGAIDGIWIWIAKPKKGECEKVQCGRKKFFCGRKHKFGLNMQAVCDAEGRFLDVEIGHPASTSDFLAFSTSRFHSKLETDGFLADGLCLFGDNADVNQTYMATPFKAVRTGAKDDYNFYHSQVRIKVECAFGMLINRWGIMRRALSAQMSLKKIGSLIICLCQLHNFCIDQRLNSQSPSSQEELPVSLDFDTVVISSAGGIPLEASQQYPDLNKNSLEQLLHGGEHFDDVPRYQRRRSPGMHCKWPTAKGHPA